jgi:hypothetical protein
LSEKTRERAQEKFCGTFSEIIGARKGGSVFEIGKRKPALQSMGVYVCFLIKPMGGKDGNSVRVGRARLV